MSRTRLAPLLALALFATPTKAEAQAEVVVPVLGAFILVEGAVVIAGTVTGIGSSVHLTGDQPRLGWPIASMVTGGIGIAWGSLLTFVFASDGDEIAPELWAFSLTPIAVGVTTFALGVAGVVRRNRAREATVEVEEEWTLAPILLNGRDSTAPGVGAFFRFD